MTDNNSSPRIAALQELQAALEEHRRSQAGTSSSVDAPASDADEMAPSRRWGFRKPGWRLPFNPWFPFDRRHPVVRRVTIAVAVAVVLLLGGSGALWWRLASGPIMLDLVTPWLTAAIGQNLGSRYSVQIGGTQLERDAQGRTALRVRDIVLRDAAGVLVAKAPKAEVGISGTSVLFASPRAESFRLVDANMNIRIDEDGRINVLVGGDQPFAVVAPASAAVNAAGQGAAPAPVSPPAIQNASGSSAPSGPYDLSLQAISERSAATNLAALVAWIDGFGGLAAQGNGGFDGQALTEIGIVNGSLTIDDRRNGHEWQLKKISLRLIRPSGGGAVLNVVSENPDRPWALNVALTPGRQDMRRLQLEARRVVLDDLLALRLDALRFRSDTLVSASIESYIAADGTPHTVTGTIVAQGGSIGDPSDPLHRIPIGSAEFALDWDIARRTLRVPFKVTSGQARYSLRSEFAAPAQPGGHWMFALGGGWIVLEPPTPGDEGLILKRVAVRGSIDPINRLVSIEHGDFGTKELGSKDDKDVSIALSGKLNYGDEPRLAIGLAGHQMSAGALMRLWPVFIAPKVREWVLEHVVAGTVERIEIATNALVAAMLPGGPPIPEEGLVVEIVGNAAELRPVAGLPPIRDADLKVRVTGRAATVALGKGVVDVSPGRRLTVTNGVFEVPNTQMVAPPARVRLRMEGAVPAAAELLALERLREFSGAPFDPGSTRGTLSAQIDLALPLRPDLPRGSTEYEIAADLSNFSADKMLFGQRVEAQALRVNASNDRYEIKGDVKIAGATAQLEYRKLTSESDAEIRLQAALDDTARARLGLDFGPTVAGVLPIKLVGRVGSDDREGRFGVEVDFAPVKVDNLLPGWVKPAGSPARAAFTLVKQKAGVRFDDLLVDGQGVLAKGTVEFDGDGEIRSANFPVFATSDGDKASVKADRGADGALRVAVRGDVYDGRNFIKTAMAGPADPKIKARHADLDLDIKIGVVAGHHGEALRGLDLRMSRRGGRVRTFMLNAKVGRDTPFIGEMRTRVANGRPVLYFETNDAGALFRFADMYPRMIGGRMWMGMDPPSQDSSPQEGLINVRDFAIRGERALERVVAGQNSPGMPNHNSVEFTLARADFVRTPGRMSIRDGVVRGPIVGATVEGNIDYVRDAISVRGTLVPLYGINNMFGQIPIVGLFLGGGSNEGIFGITYEVTGSTSNPRPVVNPISAIAPGMLRKFFEFRAAPERDRAFAEPSR